MFNLENLLINKFISNREIKKIRNPEIIFDEKNSNIYIVYEYLLKNKQGEDTYRLYKNNITKLVNEHGGLENLFKILVAADMMIQGYILIPLEGGYVCVGGDEVYALKDNTCTCPAYIHNSSTPCKHIIYRDALLLQRSKINMWKQMNTKV